MKKLVGAIALLLCFTTFGQDHFYSTKRGRITFEIALPQVGLVKGDNNTIKVLFNSQNGQLVFVTLVKDMSFNNANFAEFFDSNIRSEYPDAKIVFKGTLLNFSNKEIKGKYMMTGDLTILGQTVEIKESCMFKVNGNNFLLHVKTSKSFNGISQEGKSFVERDNNMDISCSFVLSKGVL